MKPNVNFLRKVESGEVKRIASYSTKRGGYCRFIGGEETAKKHAAEGFIKMPGVADLGRPAIATLTDAGRAALNGS